MLEITGILWLVGVAALWGLTTPLLRRGSKGIETVRGKNWLEQWLLELKFMVTMPQYSIPFAINQSGSVIYALALGSNDLSIAVPITNALTFVFVTLASKALREDEPSVQSYIGMAFIITGVTLCVADKAWNQS